MQASNSLTLLVDQVFHDYKQPVEITSAVSHRVDLITEQITAYLGSKYTSGNDENSFRKPFYQVLTQVRDVNYRAVSIKRSQIDSYSVDEDFVFSMTFEKELQEEFDRLKFGGFIKDFQEGKIDYGTVLVMETEDDSEIGYKLEVLDWSTCIIDPHDVDKGKKLFPHFLDFVELENKRNVWNEESIDEVIHKVEKAGESRVEVYHLEGVMKESQIIDSSDDEEYAYYEVYVAECEGVRYYLDHNKLKNKRVHAFVREKRPGNTAGQGVGALEEVLEEQMWINDIAISMHEALALGTKVFAKTNKKGVPGLLQLDNGTVVELEDGEDFTFESPNMPNINFFGIIDGWFNNLQRKSSTYEAVTGEEQKAGTPYAGQALQSAQASSIFNYQRERDADDIIWIIEEMIVPRMVERISSQHELNATFSPQQAALIDESIINEQLTDYMFEKDFLVTPEEIDKKRQEIASSQRKKGDRRTVSVPSEYFTVEKIKNKTRIYITKDQDDVQNKINNLVAQMSSLDPNDPTRQIFQQQIMEMSGQSPATFLPQSATGNIEGAKVSPLQRNIEAVTPNGQT